MCLIFERPAPEIANICARGVNAFVILRHGKVCSYAKHDTIGKESFERDTHGYGFLEDRYVKSPARLVIALQHVKVQLGNNDKVVRSTLP